MKAIRCALWVLLVGAILGAGIGFYFVRKGLSAREEPPALEVLVARTFRHLAVPAKSRNLANPIPLTPDVLTGARGHFADHCASCHGNDGRGRTTMGQNLYPRAPDMTLSATQSMSDGEIFATIKNGVRLTGMPAWGKDTKEDDDASWKLVHFIRHLPKVTPEELAEMESLNPRSPDELRKELKDKDEESRFLAGEDAPSQPSTKKSHH